MRRKDKEIVGFKEIEDILLNGVVCRLGLVDGGRAYIVPMNYGYANNCIYLHSALEGYKIDLINKSPEACFEVETDVAMIGSENACNSSMKYKTVIGYGIIEILQVPEEKKKGMKILVCHNSDRTDWDIPLKALEHVNVLKLEIKEMTGKRSGF
jgi:nitroimidazol reductase NimA-like FMN-containing flavoprotein (pyridoxamine 5'-phosphate oxidase superfamily)